MTERRQQCGSHRPAVDARCQHTFPRDTRSKDSGEERWEGPRDPALRREAPSSGRREVTAEEFTVGPCPDLWGIPVAAGEERIPGTRLLAFCMGL